MAPRCPTGPYSIKGKVDDLGPYKALAMLGQDMANDIRRIARKVSITGRVSKESLIDAFVVWQKRWEDSPEARKRRRNPANVVIYRKRPSGGEL